MQNKTKFFVTICNNFLNHLNNFVKMCIRDSPNRVFTREQLLEEVWGFDYFGDSRTVDVHIKRLREKLEGVEANWQLKTVWGVGYKFEVR